MSMEISDRDKTLLYIIASIMILAAAYFFGYKNFMDQRDDYKARAKTAHEEYLTLIELQKNRQMYVDMTEELLVERGLFLVEFENGYSQSNMLRELINIEKATSIWFKEITFNLPENVYTFQSENGLLGIKNATVIAYEGSYTEWKLMLESMLNINSKTKIDSVSVKYDEVNQLCEGEINISHYSVANAETQEPTVEYSLPAGISNIFDSAAVTSNTQTQAVNANYILTDYDVCILINPDKSTFDSVIVGTTNDSSAKDTITSDENGSVDVTITVDGSDGNYTLSYKVGDKTYPAKNYDKGVDFKPGDTLDLLVESSVRDGNDDKVAVKANLINNTDMKLNVLVHGDDTVFPRFSAATREGDITIYR